MTNKPLLVMSCSAVKKSTTAPVPFTDLYNGPTWQQVRCANYPVDRVACLSAEHGILSPGSKIANYDRVMDEDRLVTFVNDRVQMDRLAALIDNAGSAVVVGGELYKLLSLALVAMYPRLIGKVQFICGSYLQQRKGLSTLFAHYADPVALAA